MDKIYWIISLFLVYSLLSTDSLAQTQPPLDCIYTPDSTSRQLVQQAQEQIRAGRGARRGADTRLYRVPLRFWVIKTYDNTDSKAQMQAHVDYLNRYFKFINIEFFMAGYERLSIQQLMARNLYTIGTGDAINVIMGWSTAGGTGGGLNGSALTVAGQGQSYQGTLLHEIGHTFGLAHTFGQNNGTGEAKQLADNSNCLESGDYICDTPPDPNGLPGFSYTYVAGSSTYNGSAKDIKGNPYQPFVQRNVMSYWGSRDEPLSAGQYEMMQTVFLNYIRRKGGLNFLPPGVATLPINLTITQGQYGSQIAYPDSLRTNGVYVIESATTEIGPWQLVKALTSTTPTTIQHLNAGPGSLLYRVRTMYNDAVSISQRFSNKTYCLPPPPQTQYVSGAPEGIRSVSIPKAGLIRISGTKPDYTLINGDTLRSYGDFTEGLSGTLTVGQPYAYTITSLSQPDRYYSRILLIDLNQNGQFETNEVVGQATTGQFSVPVDALPGPTRLRVAIGNYTSRITSCWAESFLVEGEVEDYTVLIQPTNREQLTFGSVEKTQPAGHCAADTFAVAVSRTSQLAGKWVDILLSDSVGTFRSPVLIGSGAQNQIGVRLPARLASGNYRMRAALREKATIADTSGTFGGGIAEFGFWQSASIDSGAVYRPYFYRISGYHNYATSPEYVVSLGESTTTLSNTNTLQVIPTRSPSTYTLLESRSACGVNRKPISATAWLRSPTIYCVPSYSFYGDSLGQINRIQVQQTGTNTTIFDYRTAHQRVNYQNLTPVQVIPLQAGQPYSFSVSDRGFAQSLPTNVRWLANSQRRIEAWLDLNQNGVFNTDERIVIQQTPYNTGRQQTFPFQYTPPANLAVGSYTLRLKVSPVSGDGANFPCTNYYGETEDFLVDIGIPPRVKLLTTAASLSGICSGTVAIGFTTSGTFAPGTTYAIQLSDRQGQFSRPTTLASGQTSPVVISLPDSVRAGSQFRLRVWSSVAVSLAISVGHTGLPPKPTAMLPARQCLYDTVTLAVQNPQPGTQYSWQSPSKSQLKANSIRWPLESFKDIFLLTATNECGSSRSDSIRLNPVGAPTGTLRLTAYGPTSVTICQPDQARTVWVNLTSTDAYNSFAKDYSVRNLVYFRIYRDRKLIYNRPDNGYFGMATSISADTAGVYSLEMDYKGCLYAGSSLEVKAINPIARILGDSVFCALDGTHLRADVSGRSGTYHYSWSQKGQPDVLSTTNQLKTNQSGTYTLGVKDALDCPASVQTLTIRAKGPATIPELQVSKLTGSLPDSIILSTPMVINGRYRWFQEGVLIAGATRNTYVARQSGNFIVELIVDDCSVRSRTVGVDVPKPASADGPATFAVVVFPNPTQNLVTFHYYLAKEGVVHLRLTNVAGQDIQPVIHQKQSAGWHQHTTDLASQAAGVYLYSLSSGKQHQEGRLVRD